MKKYIELSDEILSRIKDGKCVKGSLQKNKKTGRLMFRAYVRHARKQDRVVCQLENGWLKESPQRYKFYNSVKKALGRRMTDVVMHRELKHAMNALEIEEILDNV